LSVEERKSGGLLRSLRRLRRTLLLVVVVVAITVVVHTLTAVWLDRFYNIYVPSVATVPGVGTIHTQGIEVYGGDLETRDGAVSIDWGTLQLGDSRNRSLCLRSLRNVPTTLAFSVDSWKPESIERYVFVSWNYSGKQIAPNEETPIRIDLKTASSTDFVDYLITNHVTSFSCSLNIQAVES
jgi:hypothetical protein